MTVMYNPTDSSPFSGKHPEIRSNTYADRHEKTRPLMALSSLAYSELPMQKLRAGHSIFPEASPEVRRIHIKDALAPIQAQDSCFMSSNFRISSTSFLASRIDRYTNRPRNNKTNIDNTTMIMVTIGYYDCTIEKLTLFHFLKK